MLNNYLRGSLFYSHILLFSYYVDCTNVAYYSRTMLETYRSYVTTPTFPSIESGLLAPYPQVAFIPGHKRNISFDSKNDLCCPQPWRPTSPTAARSRKRWVYFRFSFSRWSSFWSEYRCESYYLYFTCLLIYVFVVSVLWLQWSWKPKQDKKSSKSSSPKPKAKAQFKLAPLLIWS